MNVDSESGPIIVFRDSANRGGEGSSRRGSAEPGEDQEYFRSREQAERAAAKAATSDRARGVHQELAQLYAGLARLRKWTGR